MPDPQDGIEVVIPDSILPYVDMQANNDLMIYRQPPYFSVVEERVRVYQPKVCLELGAGVGRMSVYFLKRFGWADTFFYLQDGDAGDQQVGGIRGDSEEEFYNSFEATRTFVEANGMQTYQTITNLADAARPVDFVYSFAAIGFHWHINLYLDQLFGVLAVGGWALFEIRAPIAADEDASGQKRAEFQAFYDDQIGYARNHPGYNTVEVVGLDGYTGYRYKDQTHFLLLQKN